MNINISERVRGWLYIITIFGSVAVTYLAAKSYIAVEEVAAWTAFTAAVATMARFNLGNSPTDLAGKP